MTVFASCRQGSKGQDDKPASGASIKDSLYQLIVQRIKQSPYSAEFDTTLKGDYTLNFGYNTEEQFVVLKKENNTIDTIGSCSLGLSYKNLGYVIADFDESFIFMQSFGMGNPRYIQLYEKETGRSLLPEGASWIDADTSKGILLYSKEGIPSVSDSMSLYDVVKRKEKQYEFPSEIFSEGDILNQIQIKGAVSDSRFVIEYEAGGSTKQKSYSR